MAIIPYEVKGQTCYLIRYKAESRIRPGVKIQRQKQLGVMTLKEAQVEHNQLKREVKQELIQKERNQLSWKHLLTQWYEKDVMECHTTTSTKVDNYRTLLRYTKDWMDTPIDQLNTMSVQIIFNDMKKLELSRGRMKSVKCAINVVFDWGVLNRLIPATMLSPAKGSKLPKRESKDKPVLNRGEMQMLLRRARELEHEYYPVWATAFETGCRSGELWALQWTDVDFERRVISINKSYNSRIKKIKSTKTGEPRRVPISPGLETMLKELKLKTSHTGFVLPRINSWKRGEAAAITRDFCKLIGVREIHFHATRSCFAVMCLETGEGIASTMKLGGWKELKSFQHYVNLGSTDIGGLTDNFNILPEAKEGQVLNLRPLKAESEG